MEYEYVYVLYYTSMLRSTIFTHLTLDHPLLKCLKYAIQPSPFLKPYIAQLQSASGNRRGVPFLAAPCMWRHNRRAPHLP